MATHSSILASRIPMDRGAWQATVPGVTRVRHDLATKPHICVCVCVCVSMCVCMCVYKIEHLSK